MVFDSTKALFEVYRAKLNKEKPAGFNRDLAAEVSERLRQLSFLCDKIKELEAQITQLGILICEVTEKTKGTLSAEDTAIAHTRIGVHTSFGFEIRLYVETFYYFAFRIRTILQHKSKPLFNLHKFECIGVRDVRNHLIEHPEKQGSPIYMQSWSVGGNTQGPQLKNARREIQASSFYDRGLWVNVEEFRINLEKLLDKAINQNAL
jgi:hypothetical protein